MPDLLVPLYGDLPNPSQVKGIWTGRPLAHQAPSVLSFVSGEFGKGWKAETRTAFAAVPPTLFVAVSEDSGELTGFCCWDCTARGFLGPVGVAPGARGSGTGKALVLSVLHAMREIGYAYAIVGAAGPVGFFGKCCSVQVIEGSEPGIYGNPLAGHGTDGAR